MILRQIRQVGQNANFDGADILDGTTTSIRFLANADANAYITLSGQDMSLGGLIITMAPTASINTVADAQQALVHLDTSTATSTRRSARSAPRPSRSRTTTSSCPS